MDMALQLLVHILRQAHPVDTLARCIPVSHAVDRPGITVVRGVRLDVAQAGE